MINISKVCPACKTEKLLSEFRSNKSTKDGRDGYCKPCRNQKSKVSRQGQVDKIQEWQKNYRIQNAEKLKARGKSYTHSNKEKNLARLDFLNSAETLSNLKFCTGCSKDRQLIEFKRELQAPSGFSSRCKECIAKVSKEYTRRPEVAAKIWASNHSEEKAEKRRARAKLHPKTAEQYAKGRAASTPASQAMKRKRRRERKVRLSRATPPWADMDKIDSIYEKAVEMSGNTLGWFSVDHHIPLEGENVCGLHVFWNLKIEGILQNSSKHNRMPESDFLCDNVDKHLENVLTDDRKAPLFNTERDWWYKKVEPYKTLNLQKKKSV